jgi:thiamine biosynthesis lipoprotein
MTIHYHIILGAKLDAQQRAETQNLIERTFSFVDQVYNKWNPASELSKLNILPAEWQIPLSSEMEELLLKTEEIVKLSQGRFDPTINPLQDLWKTAREKGMEPCTSDLKALLPVIGWQNIHFKNGLFYKDFAETSIDLGGIAKGYCVDLLLERLQNAGYKDLFVEWGGEIRTSGMHPEHRPWRIFISRLQDTDPEHAIAHLELIDQAIATSGDYMQCWESEGKTFFHIFDPQQATPLNQKKGGIASVSVLAPTCAFADGLATAAMLFDSVSEAQAWAQTVQEKYPDVQFLFAVR